MIKKTIKIRNFKQFILLCADAISISMAIYLSMVIRYGDFHKTLHGNDYYSYFLTLVISLLIFSRVGLYRSIVRYMGQKAFTSVLKAVSISSLVLATSILIIQNDMPRSIPFIYWGLSLFFIGGSRLFIWFYYQALMKKDKESVAIYGAGSAGRQLLTSLSRGDKYAVQFFIDDDKEIKGYIIDGIKVYRPHHLQRLIEEKGISQLFLAIPSTNINKRRHRPICLTLRSDSKRDQ